MQATQRRVFTYLVDIQDPFCGSIVPGRASTNFILFLEGSAVNEAGRDEVGRFALIFIEFDRPLLLSAVGSGIALVEGRYVPCEKGDNVAVLMTRPVRSVVTLPSSLSSVKGEESRETDIQGQQHTCVTKTQTSTLVYDTRFHMRRDFRWRCIQPSY
jgi:hypothetical protein